MEEGVIGFLRLSLFLSASCALYEGVDGLFCAGRVRVLPVLFSSFSFFSGFPGIRTFVLLLATHYVGDERSVGGVRWSIFK